MSAATFVGRVSRTAMSGVLSLFLAAPALLAFQASIVKAATFSWHEQGTITFVGANDTDVNVGDTITGNGTLTANFVSGVEYLVNSITGTLYLNNNPALSIPVTGLIPVGDFQSNDNQLFFPQSISQQYLDFNGLGATTGSVQSNNLTNIAIYYLSTSSGKAEGDKDCGAVGYCIFVQEPPNSNLIFGPILISLSSFDVSDTPLPAALPLFASGLGALGLLGWRRTRKTTTLAA